MNTRRTFFKHLTLAAIVGKFVPGWLAKAQPIPAHNKHSVGDPVYSGTFKPWYVPVGSLFLDCQDNSIWFYTETGWVKANT